ncbi:MAG: hypothetical protein RR826_06440, partial [Christensenellaceae bacterium]
SNGIPTYLYCIIKTDGGYADMKKIGYAIFVIISSFFLVNLGIDERETMRIIPDYQEQAKGI